MGIAGYGVVGKRRRHFIDKHPNLQTTAICDRTFKESGVLEDGAHFYTNYKDLLREPLDLLFVCMTNDIAPEVTIEGLKKGLHVFCEKPPGRTIADVVSVIKVQKENPKLKLKYGFNHRYHESVKRALEIIRSGELGTLINLRGVYGKSKIINYASNWRSQRALAGGGILLDQGIHMVDMMRLFAGEFVDIKSYISNSFWNYDVEDNAYALMRTKEGVVAMLHSSATQWRHRFHLEIALTKGLINLSGILSSSKSYGAETITVAYASEDDAGDPIENRTRYNTDNSWQDEINEFADCILESRPVLKGSSEDALRTMKLVYDIYCADPEWKKRFSLTSEFPKDALNSAANIGLEPNPLSALEIN